MRNKVQLVKDYSIGGLDLLPGTVLVSTDPMNGLEAMGVAVRLKDTPPEPATEPAEIRVNEPVVTVREPKVRRTRTA